MIWVAQNLLPTALGAVLICGVLAAGLSSASTFYRLWVLALVTIFWATGPRRVPQRSVKLRRNCVPQIAMLLLDCL